MFKPFDVRKINVTVESFASLQSMIIRVLKRRDFIESDSRDAQKGEQPDLIIACLTFARSLIYYRGTGMLLSIIGSYTLESC